MNKLKSMLPASLNGSAAASSKRQSESLEPEIGFQLTIEASSASNGNEHHYTNTVIPELNVNLIAARHLPSLFGFKIVQGYLIKVKLFPGSKRLDSTIQTNTWPKFNETFKFPLAPEIKPSLKHSSRRGSKAAVADITPEELITGQFVVFTVYALLELPPTSFNRFSKTYRSLKDKSTNLMQNIFEEKSEKSTTDEKENSKNKRKSQDNPRDAMPPLTISESRRNLGAVTCYLQPKLFKRNARGVFATEELWMPIKDINTTVKKGPNDNNNNLANSTKGVVEIALEVKDVCEPIDPTNSESTTSTLNNGNSSFDSNDSTASTSTVTSSKEAKSWNNRMTSEMKRKMGISNVNTKRPHNLLLKVTTSRMRCSNKVKDELEATAGSVYVKTTIYDNGIYVDSWKSPNFYPSLATKWDVGNEVATLSIPLQNLEHLDRIMIKTTLATKTKMAKKLVLGTVIVGGPASGPGITPSGAEQMASLKEAPLNEKIPLWHCYQ
ncbi:uncharacterized protein LOC142234697 [Haematobia irritans]|uniref:uncharacterized protein LOC142234697 n=1 Tax=Haematobia irritans TaxID=7368 RepID=UPI003F50974A